MGEEGIYRQISSRVGAASVMETTSSVASSSLKFAFNFPVEDGALNEIKVYKEATISTTPVTLRLGGN